MYIYYLYLLSFILMLYRAPFDTSPVTEGVTLFKHQLLLFTGFQALRSQTVLWYSTTTATRFLAWSEKRVTVLQKHQHTDFQCNVHTIKKTKLKRSWSFLSDIKKNQARRCHHLKLERVCLICVRVPYHLTYRGS